MKSDGKARGSGISMLIFGLASLGLVIVPSLINRDCGLAGGWVVFYLACLLWWWVVQFGPHRWFGSYRAAGLRRRAAGLRGSEMGCRVDA